MANVDTVKSITDNLQTVLQAQGIKFARKAYDDIKAVPASLLPLGDIFYEGEDFEYTHGQRQGYAELRFVLRVVLRERDHQSLMREKQEWVHRIRGALTVDALNIGDLLSTKSVSRVTASGVEISDSQNTSSLDYTISVRYREV